MLEKVYDWILDHLAQLMQSLFRYRDPATDRHLRDLDRKKDEHSQ
jgi:hypothetical protein